MAECGTESSYSNDGCRCDACRKASTEARRKRARDKDRLREWSRADRAKKPEVYRAKSAKWAKANREKRKAMKDRWYYERGGRELSLAYADRRAGIDRSIERRCAVCRELLPERAFSNKLYCGQRCGGFAHRIKTVYGLTFDEYHAIWDSQGGKCAACNGQLSGMRAKDTHLDHCHVSGRVRGFLHASCNSALGLLNEDPDRIASLAKYAREHSQMRLTEEAA